MTPGEAFDIMAEKFGVGDYDEWTATVPYWRWRMGEVAKIRAMMRRRRVSMQELVIAIEYAVAHRKPTCGCSTPSRRRTGARSSRPTWATGGCATRSPRRATTGS